MTSDEFIINIEEVLNYSLDDSDGWSYYNYDGYKVLTNKQEILLLISNERNCCESWGYFWTNDKISDFIFSLLTEIRVTDTSLNSKTLEEVYLGEGDVIFIDLITSAGVLQFTAYNGHNGHYGHLALVRSKQITEDWAL